MYGAHHLGASIADPVNPPRLRKRGERFNDHTIKVLLAQRREDDARLYAGDNAVDDYMRRNAVDTA